MTDSFSIFKLALDQFPCALITDANGCYIYVNKGWCEYMGYSPESVYGKKVHSIAPDTKVDEALRSGKPTLGYQIIGKNGQPLFNHCIPLKEQEKIIGTVVLTFFYNFQEAMDFSKTIASLSEKVNYYQEELRRLRGSRHSIDEIIGNSSAIQDLKEQIENAALTMSTVLIQGETGCGKELVANAIHDLSPRRDKPFIKINCSAIPPDLVESELFGYEGGAFTGASRSGKRGLFEAADTGSLFLDEIHQMAYFVQPKLLRVLQEKEVQHVGSSASISIDTRIIAATNKPLEELVAQNQFREDLYYRLNVVTIKVPPLRERLEDIPELTNHLRQKLNRELGMHVEGITSEAEGRLMHYSWPGNVRELNNVLERAMNMQKNGVLTWDSFKDYFEMRQQYYRDSSHQTLAASREQAEKNILSACLKKNKYNKTKTAAELGISRTMLYQKLYKYQLL